MYKIIVLTITITVSLTSLIGEKAFAYLTMASLNTYRKVTIPDAVERVAELKSDGVWFITQNMDFTDSEYHAIFTTLGGLQMSEDNPDANKSYTDYVRVMGTPPNGSMCYNETGGLPGGTLLSNTQIDNMYASHGNRPITCLTRSYGGDWRTQTDRCLNNAKVSGICMEYVKEALLENINAPAECINATLAKGERCFLLLHGGASDGWSDAENEQIIENLNSWAPAAMQSNNVVLVYQNYSGGESDWLADSESVKSAIIQACNMPNYTGAGYGVPEPSALCMLLCGALILLGRRITSQIMRTGKRRGNNDPANLCHRSPLTPMAPVASD